MITIEPASKAHVHAIVSSLRDDDRQEITSIGADPLEAALESHRFAVWAKVATVEGEIAALWGVGGIMLGMTGRPWLLTTPVSDRIAMRFALIYRREAREMLDLFPRLENYCAAAYDRATRLLQLTGFTVDDPKPIGPHAALFRRFWMVR